MSKKVAILYGGLSTEREVSLNTGKSIFKALKTKEYHTELIDADRNLAEKLKESSPDVAVIALHGKYGEDGCVQGLLEILGIPYTGPGVMASSLAMNKIMTKKILVFEGIPTPDFMVLNGRDAGPEELTGQILKKMEPPLVLKAASQGSSIGICFAFDKHEIGTGLTECLKYDTEILVEQFVKGREFTVSVMGNEDPVALPILEIVSSTGVYDYHAKYTPGASDHFVAGLPANTENTIKDLALRTYKAIGCIGLSRVDFLLAEDGKPYVIEVNTSPGMTATSLFPDAAKAAGISFPDLIEKLVNYALEAHKSRK
ncbi:MAG: D-alanine--D-alanine ligase [Firmicutes bacterium HGW-Firmicutes-14]|jgi:D-alanine-D-alanine ligase|nr:MAG: D-alanine--D-alanine ligase [Firmicutes bacterium HGW-Firmicutes-14]